MILTNILTYWIAKCYQINEALRQYFEDTEVEILDALEMKQLKLDVVHELNEIYVWIEKVFLLPLTPLFK